MEEDIPGFSSSPQRSSEPCSAQQKLGEVFLLLKNCQTEDAGHSQKSPPQPGQARAREIWRRPDPPGLRLRWGGCGWATAQGGGGPSGGEAASAHRCPQVTEEHGDCPLLCLPRRSTSAKVWPQGNLLTTKTTCALRTRTGNPNAAQKTRAACQGRGHPGPGARRSSRGERAAGVRASGREGVSGDVSFTAPLTAGTGSQPGQWTVGRSPLHLRVLTSPGPFCRPQACSGTQQTQARLADPQMPLRHLFAWSPHVLEAGGGGVWSVCVRRPRGSCSFQSRPGETMSLMGLLKVSAHFLSPVWLFFHYFKFFYWLIWGEKHQFVFHSFMCS